MGTRQRKQLREDARGSSPSPAGAPGRDPKTGRFLAGNTHGKGNPLAAQAQRLRVALFAAITPEDMLAILRRLVRMARRGDLGAARLVLDRCFGRPQVGTEVMTEEEAFDPDDRYL